MKDAFLHSSSLSKVRKRGSCRFFRLVAALLGLDNNESSTMEHLLHSLLPPKKFVDQNRPEPGVGSSP